MVRWGILQVIISIILGNLKTVKRKDTPSTSKPNVIEPKNPEPFKDPITDILRQGGVKPLAKGDLMEEILKLMTLLLG